MMSVGSTQAAKTLELSSVGLSFSRRLSGCLLVAPQLASLRFACRLTLRALESLGLDRDAAEALSTSPPPLVNVASLPPLSGFLVGPASWRVFLVEIAVVFPAVVEPVERLFGPRAFFEVAEERLLVASIAMLV